MSGIKMRKFLNFKANLGELSNYVKCNPKGVYYIENSFFKSKSTRYFMYLRKQGLDMNQAFDHLLGEESKKSIDP
ncbi:hypothetical protein P0M11_12760 [Kaistella sp. PBT33-4]|uniref:hypothetical protein n=1 Tax=Kaistella sp. PBT33-4 TaxID=3032000 RepID=UPI0023D7FC62|nr:hypothetical protein [Kaistella sp. PBT33-4]MDF0720871.1 hypothetical protein [Kaistella sp. PBT33-4]